MKLIQIDQRESLRKRGFKRESWPWQHLQQQLLKVPAGVGPRLQPWRFNIQVTTCHYKALSPPIAYWKTAFRNTLYGRVVDKTDDVQVYCVTALVFLWIHSMTAIREKKQIFLLDLQSSTLEHQGRHIHSCWHFFTYVCFTGIPLPSLSPFACPISICS